MVRYFVLDPVRSLPYALNGGRVEVRVQFTDSRGARRHSVRGSEWRVAPGEVVRFDDRDRNLLRGVQSVVDESGNALFSEVAPQALSLDLDTALLPARAAATVMAVRR